MTDITDEQRAAWEEAQAYDFADLLAPLLPSELTDPQPVLPIEPGVYQDAHGFVVIHKSTRWYGDGGYVDPDALVLPLTRLVPERPQITDDEINEAWSNAGEDESIQRHRDGSMSAVGAFHAGFRADLTKGADRD